MIEKTKIASDSFDVTGGFLFLWHLHETRKNSCEILLLHILQIPINIEIGSIYYDSSTFLTRVYLF